jgi:hypothetical protein
MVRAIVFGDWGVHQQPAMVGDQRTDPAMWAVSHLPTGHNIGVALDLTLWESVRIARALDDADPFPDGLFDASDDEGPWVALSAIGAALNDHYVWPICGYAEAT